jgi:hypothetical protein
MGYVSNLFIGLRLIEVGDQMNMGEGEQLSISGLVSTNNEKIPFQNQLSINLTINAEIPLISIVKGIEQQIIEYFYLQRKQSLPMLAGYHFDFPLIWQYFQDTKFTFQILLLLMQILFDFEISMIFKKGSRTKGGNDTRDRIAKFKNKMLKSLENLIVHPVRYLKKNMKDPSEISTYNAFILSISNFIQILDFLLAKEAQNMDDFYFLMIPKYSITFEGAVEKDEQGHTHHDEIATLIEDCLSVNPEEERKKQFSFSSSSRLIKSHYCQPDSKLVLQMMDYSIDYRNEIVCNYRSIVSWPLFEKAIYHLFLSISHCPHVIMSGFKNQGKLETIRAFSSLVAANYYECDFVSSPSLQTMSNYLYGMISGGYWLTFKNVEKTENTMLSVLASFAQEIRYCLEQKKSKINVWGEDLLINGNHVIYLTFNQVSSDTQRKFENLPINILDNFRIITVNKPDYSKIVASLVHGVFDSQEEQIEWTNKFLYLVKIVGSLEDLSEGADLMAAERFQLSRFRLSLKDIYNVLSNSVVEYFQSIDLYYESFKEKTGKYRVDINILKLDFDRELMFTRCVKSNLLKIVTMFESCANDSKVVDKFIDRIFRPRDGRVDIENRGPELFPKEKIIKIIKTYKEHEPHSNLGSDENMIFQSVKQCLEIVMSDTAERQFIIYGKPNTQKSTLLKLVSFIESELKNINFAQFWLNLECLTKEDIFGTGKFDGILKEIILQSNNINLEEKQSNTRKINYLFQSNADIYNKLADFRNPKKFKINKDLDRGSSWIIVDANSSQNNSSIGERVNYLLGMFSNLNEFKEVNQFVGFSHKLKIVYEINSVSGLEPNLLSEKHLIYMKESLQSLDDRVEQSFASLRSCNPFFEMVSPILNDVVQGLVYPTLAKMEEMAGEKELVFFMSNLTLLNNFLTYFEIFLNEFRKYYQAYNFSEVKTNPEYLMSLKKNTGKGNKQITSINHQFSYGSAMKMAQEAGGVSLITSQRKKKVDVKSEDSIIQSLKSKEDVEDMEKRKIEGITVFCLVQALSPNVFSKSMNGFCSALEQICLGYAAKKGVGKFLFADGVLKMMHEKSTASGKLDLAKLFYDFSRGKWCPWQEVEIGSFPDISQSFSNEVFSRNELKRLNCQLSPAYHKSLNTQDDIQVLMGLHERNIVMNSTTIKMNYMLDLFISYKKHILLLSEHQQGKSILIGSTVLKKLIEQDKIISFKFNMQKDSSPSTVQSQIENNLLKMGGNVISPPEDKRVVIWLEDLHLSMNEEKPESLMRNLQVQGGWYSSQKRNFIKLTDSQFLMTMSLKESNEESSRNTVNSVGVDVLSKTTLMKTHRINYSELSTIYFKLVENEIDPSATTKKEKLISKLFQELSKVIYFNFDNLNNISTSRQVNLTLEGFGQFAQSLNLIDWTSVVEHPEDVLFVWNKMLMDFFNCDFSFQHHEFETIIRVKKHKMNFIRIDKRTSIFDHKVVLKMASILNKDLLDLDQKSAENDNQSETRSRKKSGTDSSFKQSTPAKSPSPELPKQASQGTRFKSIMLNKSLAPINNIVEEVDEVSENESSSKEKSSKHEEELPDELRLEYKGSSYVPLKKIDERGPEEEAENRGRSDPESSSDESGSDEKKPKKKGKGGKDETFKRSKTTKESKGETEEKLGSERRIKRGSEAKESVEGRKENEDQAEKSNMENSNEDSGTPKSSKEAEVEGSKKEGSQEGSGSSAKEHSGSQSDSNSEDEEGEEEDAEDEFSEEINEDEVRNQYLINPDQQLKNYLRKFISKTENIKMPNTVDLLGVQKLVCFDRKLLFDDMVLKELKETKDAKDFNEIDDRLFNVVQPGTQADLMRFIKATLINYVKSHPESLYALRLDGGNFPLFIHDYSMLMQNMFTEFQHIFISSVKSLFYSKSLVDYICSNLACNFDYIDLLSCNATRVVEDKVVHLNACEYMIQRIFESFNEIWKEKKKIIMLHIPNSALCPEHMPLLDQVLGFISSIVMNTDMMQKYFGTRFKQMVSAARNDGHYSHFSEAQFNYLVRNRFESKITFIIINDSTQNYIQGLKMKNMSSEKTKEIYSYICENYSKLSTRFRKIVVNGLKCLEPEETPPFYQPPLPFEELEITNFCAKCLNLELNFLRNVDKEKDYLTILRTYNENIILFNSMRYLLNLKFSTMDSDSDLTDMEKEKNLVLQKIERRKDIIQLELKEIDSQIQNKIKEKEAVLAKQEELQMRKDEYIEKKVNYQEKVNKFNQSIQEAQKEEQLYQDLKFGLQETLKGLKDLNEKDLQTSISSGGFFGSKAFAIYSVLFCEYYQIEVKERVTVSEIEQMNESSVDMTRMKGYTKIFEEICMSFQGSLLTIINKEANNTEDPELLKALCSLIERSSTDMSTMSVLNNVQRMLTKIIDSQLEITKLGMKKSKRDDDINFLKSTAAYITMQMDKADQFLEMIDSGLKEKPVLFEKIGERISYLAKKKESDEATILKLNQLGEEYKAIQETFARVNNPILYSKVARQTIVDVLAAYIVLYNKYPFQVKKKMLYVTLKNLKIDLNFFNEIPIYEILSNSMIMTDIVRSKISCNINFLTNLSIIDFITEDQTFLYPLIIDQSKLMMKYLYSKHPKGFGKCRYNPSSNTISAIENCMKTGSIFVVVDPGDELMKMIRPIIEWQFRRFSEAILITNGNAIETTDKINFFERKIRIAKGFYLLIVLEIVPIESIDQYLLSKLLVLDNTMLNEGLFCEAMADELAINLESNTRGFHLSEYLNRSLQTTIIEKYKETMKSSKTFDFLKDTFETQTFAKLRAQIEGFKALVSTWDKEKDSRQKALVEYQVYQQKIYSLKILSVNDANEFAFLNYPFGYKISGMLNLIMKFLPFANKFWLYFLSLDKMKRFVGDSFTLNYDIFSHIIKHTISSMDVKITSVDIEKKSANFLKLFSQVEKTVFSTISSMIPSKFLHIMSFILGVLVQNKHTKNKLGFENHTNMFLMSEKILEPSYSNIEICSNDLYSRFNEGFSKISGFFNDTASNIPQLRSLNNNFEQDIVLLTQFEARNKQQGNGQQVFTVQNMKESNLESFKSTPDYECSAKDNSEIILSLISQLDFFSRDQKVKEIAGMKVTIEQLQAILESKYNQLQKEPKGQIISFDSQGQYTEKLREPISPVKRSSERRSSKFLSQMRLIEKTQQYEGRKSLKSFTKLFIEKQRIYKENVKEFDSQFVLYLQKAMSIIYGLDINLQSEDPSWEVFFHLSRMYLKPASDQSMIPMCSVSEQLYEKCDLLTIAAFIKHSRPDWLFRIFEIFYSELKGSDFAPVHQTLDFIYTYSSNKRSTLLLYENLSSNPFSLIERFAKKVNHKIEIFNVMKDSLEDCKNLLDGSQKKGTWVVIENMYLLPESVQIQFIDQVNSVFEKGAGSNYFRVWIIYKVGSEAMRFKASSKSLPGWFGLCYYAFLSDSSNLHSEMLSLHHKEFAEYSGQLLQNIERGVRKEALPVVLDQFTPQKPSSLDQSPLSDSKSVHEIAQMIGDIMPPVPTAKILHVEKKKYNLMRDLMMHNHSGLQEENEQEQQRVRFAIKLVYALLRQRRAKLTNLLGKQFYLEFKIPNDLPLQAILDCMFNSMKRAGTREHHQFIFQAIDHLFSSTIDLEDFSCSPLLLKNFLETFAFSLPKGSVIIQYEEANYVIPAMAKFASFGEVFMESINTMPMEDNCKIFGFQNNEEVICDYTKSCRSFKFLNQNLKIPELLDEKSNYIEDFDLDNFIEDNSKNEKDIIVRFFLNCIEYGYNIIQNHEFKNHMDVEFKKFLDTTMDLLSHKNLKKVETSLLESLPSEVKPSEVSLPAKRKPEKSSISPFDKSLYIGIPQKKATKAFDQTDFFMQTGFTPRNSQVYLTRNTDQRSNRSRFWRYIVLQEYKVLKYIIETVTRDLSIIQLSLEGELTGAPPSQIKQMVQELTANQIPLSWRSKLRQFNINMFNLKEMIKSILIRFDTIYGIVIELKKELPPILNISRFLSPGAFLLNTINFNSWVNQVILSLTQTSFCDSVIMLNPNEGDNQKIFSNSIVWTINGMKIRGAKIDSEGLLIDEQSKDYYSELPPLHLEITQFDRSKRRSIVSHLLIEGRRTARDFDSEPVL